MSRPDRDEIADQILDIEVLPELKDDVAALGVKCRRLTDIYGLAILKLITECLPLVARIVDGWDQLPARALDRGGFVWHSGDNLLLIQRSAARDLTALAVFAPDRSYDALILLLETDGEMDTAELATPAGADRVQGIAVRRLTFDADTISGAEHAGARPDPRRELDRLFRRSRGDLLQNPDADLRFAIDLSRASPDGRTRDGAEMRALARMHAMRDMSTVNLTPDELDDLLLFLRWLPGYLDRARDIQGA